MRTGYTTIQHWMLDLGLNLSEVMVLAVIYGFSQDGESSFRGTRKYLAEMSLCSVRKVSDILNSLVDKGYVIKNDIETRGVKTPEYRVDVDFCMGSAESARGYAESAHQDNTRYNTSKEVKEKDSLKRVQKENEEKASSQSPAAAGEKTPTPTPSPSPRTFRRPSVEEVRYYCREKNLYVNPDTFVDFYESKGWMVGKSPMKDWRAAVRNWARTDWRQGNKNENQYDRRRYSDVKATSPDEYKDEPF